MIAFLIACHASPHESAAADDSTQIVDDSAAPVDDSAAPPDDSTASPDDSAPPDDSGTIPKPEGRLVIVGGGSEGEMDDKTAWSFDVYRAMLAKGDVTGDGLVRVAVVATGDETTWIPEYFVSLGADDAYNVKVDTRQAADAPEILKDFEQVDVVFLKGGDQGEYYDKWNDTALDTAVRGVFASGGCVAGTSAGAMSLSEYALAGTGDYETPSVLADGATTTLDDFTSGGSAIHTDFLGLLPGALVDSHFSTRARLGRLAGAMGRVFDEGGPVSLLGVGIDEQTAIIVDGTLAQVKGVGSVTFLRRGSEDAVRTPGLPLVFADLQLDRLTDGWSYDLAAQAPIVDPLPVVAEAVKWDGALDVQSTGAWSILGDVVGDEEAFGSVVERWPDPYAVRDGTAGVQLENAIGILDAQDDEMHGVDDEIAFRALYDHLGTIVFLVGDTGALSRASGALTMGPNGKTPMATMILDASAATARSLSPYVSQEDAGDGALHAAGLVGVTLDILYTGTDGRVYDPALRAPVTP